MAVSPGFSALIIELLAPMGHVAVRRMFGGAGVYCEGLMLGLIADDTLYFKADDATKADFEAEGLGPFTYAAKTRTMSLPYWRAPDRLFDDSDEMLIWAHKALAVARNAAAAKPAAKSRDKPPARPGKKRSGPRG